jgi:hypothetical protein
MGLQVAYIPLIIIAIIIIVAIILLKKYDLF